jgi:hypothetical protein
MRVWLQPASVVEEQLMDLLCADLIEQPPPLPRTGDIKSPDHSPE